ncbi:hypothetical protein ACFIOY_37775 [Bradyrhizobium sp. TZ2]
MKVTDSVGVSGKMAKGGAGDGAETLDYAHPLLKLDWLGKGNLIALAIDEFIAAVCLPSQTKLGRQLSLQGLRDAKRVPC